MSRAANDWAWSLNIKPASLKLLLLSLCDRADEEHCCFPSLKRLVADTGLDQKTISSHMTKLISLGVMEDTGERKGATRRVKVYRLIGIDAGVTEIDIRSKCNNPENGSISESTENEGGEKAPNTPKNGGVDNSPNGSKNGAVNNSPNRSENGSLNRSENGSLNQSLEPLNKNNKKIVYDDSRIHEAFAYFYESGLPKKNPELTEQCFRELLVETEREPMELAQELRTDIQTRLRNNQTSFHRLSPHKYLSKKRWLDPYSIRRGDHKVSVDPNQKLIEDIDAELRQLQTNLLGERKDLEERARLGMLTPQLQSFYENSIHKHQLKIKELEQQRERLKPFRGQARVGQGGSRG